MEQQAHWLVEDTGIDGRTWYTVRLRDLDGAPHYHGPFRSAETATKFYWVARNKFGELNCEMNNRLAFKDLKRDYEEAVAYLGEPPALAQQAG